MKSKKIGIIGGVGPQATAYLYSKIIQLAQEKYSAKNNDDYPNVIINSLPIPDFISNKVSIAKALEMLKECVSNFSKSGIDKICIASNTVHVLLSELSSTTKIPFISMIELVSDKCLKYGYKKVALLGTPVLTHSGLYNEALKKRGIEIIIPEDRELIIVEEIIRSVIAGKVIETDKNKYIELINKLFSMGAESIILGCTELPLAIDYTVLGKRILNSDEILAEGIVDYYYS
ncbi:MAG: amino acid racemase [bacterium]